MPPLGAARWVPAFPFKPDTFFHFGWPVVAAVREPVTEAQPAPVA